MIVRRAEDDDLDEIVALGARCLGWRGDARDRAFFRWKHHENPFGRSPCWVAEDSGRLVGLRTFLRWRFVHGTTGERLEVVRAVDTATDPELQGRGIFRELTMTALEELAGDGLAAVFNTPNDKSKPGYLKMGWTELGRPRVLVRPLSLRGIRRAAGARAPAQIWPGADLPELGHPVSELPAHVFPPRPTWRTDRDEAYRSWRYRFEPLGYRQTAAPHGGSVFRLRRRGPAVEVSLCEIHGPTPALDGDIRRHADFVLAAGRTWRRVGIPVPGLGPSVTWRPLGRPELPSLADLDLGLSDLELF